MCHFVSVVIPIMLFMWQHTLYSTCVLCCRGDVYLCSCCKPSINGIRFIRFLDMPRQKSTRESSERHWNQRPSWLILRSTNLRQLNETRADRRSELLRKKATRKGEFLRSFRVPRQSSTRRRLFTETAEDLKFWAEHGSWAYCRRGSLQSKKRLPPFQKRSQPSSSAACSCSAGRYKVPHARRNPPALQNLTIDEIYTLRPFRAFSGRYTQMMFGYRVREEPFKIRWA